MSMDIKNILAHTDHTNLSPTSTEADIRRLADEATEMRTASICIAPAYVKAAKEYCGDRMKICTVIGFPNGYATTAAKVFETEDAIRNGADEVDMVINLGMVKDGRFDELSEEIKCVRKASMGKILKVIVETGLLNEKEKVTLCKICEECEADFIKTSTGFLSGGAAEEDIRLFARTIKGNMKIKASGGISTLEDAEKLLECGAARLGASRLVRLAKEVL